MELNSSRPFRLATGTVAASVLAVALTVVTVLRPSPRPADDDQVGASNAPPYSYTSVLGLGDSVIAAAACSCDSFVSQLGAELGDGEGHPVAVVNAGVNGLTSRDLLRQVQNNRTRAMPTAVTTIVIGANDFDPGLLSRTGCSGAELSCFRASLTSLATNVDGLLSTLRRGPGSSGPILLLGYWNVFLDGAVGATRGQAYQKDSDALTRGVNAVLTRASQTYSATFVDLYAAFKRDADDTDLLAEDGDHPSAQGHTLIAALLSEALGVRKPQPRSAVR